MISSNQFRTNNYTTPLKYIKNTSLFPYISALLILLQYFGDPRHFNKWFFDHCRYRDGGLHQFRCLAGSPPFSLGHVCPGGLGLRKASPAGDGLK